MPNLLMRSRLEKRRLPAINFVSLLAGEEQNTPLERGRPLRRLRARARLTYTITVLGAAAYAADAPFSIFRRLEFTRIGDHPVIRDDGYPLETLSMLKRGRISYQSLPTPAVATINVDWDLPMTMFPPDSPFKRGWTIPIPALGEDQLIATLGNIVVGNAADLWSVEPTTWTLDAVSIIITQEVEDTPNPLELIARHSSRKVPLMQRLIGATEVMSANTPDQRIPGNNIGLSGEMISSLLICRTTATGARSDFPGVTALRFILGNRTIIDSTPEALTRSMVADVGGGDVVIPTGVLLVNHDEEGLLDSTLPTHEHPQSRWEADIGATAVTLELLRSELLEFTG